MQRELELIAGAELGSEVILCDRGTLDGLAYWPDSSESFFDDLHTSHTAELARYDAVIHLRTPTRRDGYHKDALRIERASQAETLDARLLEIWKDHPHRFVVESSRMIASVRFAFSRKSWVLLPPDCREP